ncbi:MAG: hypothetical protein ACOYMN_04380 [Roseimicrobium sp.]
MTPSNARIVLLAGLAVVLVLLLALGMAGVLWGWPPSFVVNGFSWE